MKRIIMALMVVLAITGVVASQHNTITQASQQGDVMLGLNNLIGQGGIQFTTIAQDSDDNDIIQANTQDATEIGESNGVEEINIQATGVAGDDNDAIQIGDQGATTIGDFNGIGQINSQGSGIFGDDNFVLQDGSQDAAAIGDGSNLGQNSLQLTLLFGDDVTSLQSSDQDTVAGDSSDTMQDTIQATLIVNN